MPGATTPLNIPYPVAGDTLAGAVQSTPQLMAERLNDLIAALSGVSPAASGGTGYGSGWTGPGLQLYRRAGLVCAVIDLTKANYTAGEQICSIPAGFRPPANFTWNASWGNGGNVRELQINSNGGLYSLNAGTGGVRGLTTYAI